MTFCACRTMCVKERCHLKPKKAHKSSQKLQDLNWNSQCPPQKKKSDIPKNRDVFQACFFGKQATFPRSYSTKPIHLGAPDWSLSSNRSSTSGGGRGNCFFWGILAFQCNNCGEVLQIDVNSPNILSNLVKSPRTLNTLNRWIPVVAMAANECIINCKHVAWWCTIGRWNFIEN